MHHYDFTVHGSTCTLKCDTQKLPLAYENWLDGVRPSVRKRYR